MLLRIEQKAAVESNLRDIIFDNVISFWKVASLFVRMKIKPRPFSLSDRRLHLFLFTNWPFLGFYIWSTKEDFMERGDGSYDSTSFILDYIRVYIGGMYRYTDWCTVLKYTRRQAERISTIFLNFFLPSSTWLFTTSCRSVNIYISTCFGVTGPSYKQSITWRFPINWQQVAQRIN